MRHGWLAVAAISFAQEPSPPALQQPRGSIEGVIRTRGDDGPQQQQPIPGVDVTVGRVDTKTDAAGRYMVRDLAPGRYEVRVGQAFRIPADRASQTVTVLPGQAVTVNFSLALRGVISGRVVDVNDEPVPNAEVALLGREFGSGSVRYFRRHATSTNDQGEYRIESVRPNIAYAVLVRAGDVRSQPDAPTDPRLRRPTPIPSYFPGVIDLAGATPVTLRSGEHREAVNVTLQRGPSYCIEAQMAGANVLFIREAHIPYGIGPSGGTTGMPRMATEPGPDGRIRVCGVPPGEYLLTSLNGDLNEPDALATMPISIGERDALNVTLQPVPRMKIPVEFAWRAEPPEKPVEAKLSVYLQSMTRSFGAYAGLERPVPVPASAETSHVHLDDYYHRVSGLTGRLYIQAVLYGNETITQAPLRVGSAPAGTALRVVVGHDGVLVKARTSPGATVVVMPASVANDGELASAMRFGRADQFGEYVSTRAVAPGRYFVVALNEPLSEPVSPEEVAKLAGLRTSSRAKEVSAEPNATVEVRLEAVD